MYIYHITKELDHRGVFVPRVPEYAEDYDEDCEIGRVCFSDSLEGCLSSVSWGSWDTKKNLEDTEGVIKVFRLWITPELVQRGIIYTPEYLAKNDFVADAWATREYWLLQPYTFGSTETCYIKVLGYDIACLSETGIKPSSEYKSGDKDIITNLKYQVLV